MQTNQGMRLPDLLPAFLTRLWARLVRLVAPHPAAVGLVPTPPLALVAPADHPAVLAELPLLDELPLGDTRTTTGTEPTHEQFQ